MKGGEIPIKTMAVLQPFYRLPTKAITAAGFFILKLIFRLTDFYDFNFSERLAMTYVSFISCFILKFYNMNFLGSTLL